MVNKDNYKTIKKKLLEYELQMKIKELNLHTRAVDESIELMSSYNVRCIRMIQTQKEIKSITSELSRFQ